MGNQVSRKAEQDFLRDEIESHYRPIACNQQKAMENPSVRLIPLPKENAGGALMKKNPHIGPTLKEAITDLKRRDVEFALLYEEEKAKERMSEVLKQIRKDLGLTQQQVADKAGVSQALIGRMEGKGGVRLLPPLKSFRRVLDALGYETELVIRKKAA